MFVTLSSLSTSFTAYWLSHSETSMLREVQLDKLSAAEGQSLQLANHLSEDTESSCDEEEGAAGTSNAFALLSEDC